MSHSASIVQSVRIHTSVFIGTHAQTVQCLLKRADYS